MTMLERIAHQFDGLLLSHLTEVELKVFEILCEAGFLVFDESEEDYGRLVSSLQPKRFDRIQQIVKTKMGA